MVKQGQHVTFADPTGKQHDALVTAVWGDKCINVVYVDLEEGQRDNYGQKIKRYTSVMHRSVQQAHGNFWFDPTGEVEEELKAKDAEQKALAEAASK